MGAGLFVGIDVSKARLDVAWSDGRVEEVANHDDEIARFVERIAEAKPTCVVM